MGKAPALFAPMTLEAAVAARRRVTESQQWKRLIHDEVERLLGQSTEPITSEELRARAKVA